MGIDLEAIRQRNEEFANCEDPSHRHPDGTITQRIGKADIEALLAEVERLQLRESATLAALRSACAEFGDNGWADDLHPADVLEKHLLRHLIE